MKNNVIKIIIVLVVIAMVGGVYFIKNYIKKKIKKYNKNI